MRWFSSRLYCLLSIFSGQTSYFFYQSSNLGGVSNNLFICSIYLLYLYIFNIVICLCCINCTNIKSLYKVHSVEWHRRDRRE